jgi:cell division protein FtsQ
MKVLRLLVVLVAGALLYRGGQAVYRSQALKLEKFEVVGNTESRVGDEEIVKATGKQVGDHLLGVSTKKVALRLQELPWVAEAKAERILPSTLKITVRERKAAMVVQSGQGPFLVDADGLVLQQGSEDLVTLTDLPLAQVSPGSRIATPEFVHAARILRSLPEEIRGKVNAVRAPSIDQIQIETGGGPMIYYGAAEQIAEKNFAAETLFSGPAAGAAGAGVIDVRVPSRPATRPR